MTTDYLEWAKTRADARFNLATSGIAPLPIRDLAFTADDLELNDEAAYGYAPLQRALASKCGVSVDNVVAAVGTTQANHLAMAALLETGDEVLMEHPVYEPLPALARHLGAEVKFFERHLENGFGIDPDEVSRGVTGRTRLIVLTNLHNPTGALTDQRTLERIGAIARDAGARVLVDEVYLEMMWVGSERPHPWMGSAFHLGNEFVITTSLTKAYGLGGLRCGWILAEPDLARRMWRLLDLFIGAASVPAERLGVVALKRLGPIADRAQALLQRNRPLLDRFLRSRHDLDSVPGLGTMSFPRWTAGNIEELCTRLRVKHETTVVPGRFFGLPQHVRIGIGGETTMVAQGLERLATAMDECRSQEAPPARRPG